MREHGVGGVKSRKFDEASDVAGRVRAMFGDCYTAATSARRSVMSTFWPREPFPSATTSMSCHMSEIRFRDQAGWQWEVIESTKKRAGDGQSQRERTLYFLNRYETRRIAEFPADWAKRSSKELVQLCEVAERL
jgi:hypothetical protein